MEIHNKINETMEYIISEIASLMSPEEYLKREGLLYSWEDWMKGTSKEEFNPEQLTEPQAEKALAFMVGYELGKKERDGNVR